MIVIVSSKIKQKSNSLTKRKNMDCKQAKKIGLVSILKKINAIEKKKTKNEIWYLSPLRNEQDASFKIDVSKNLWFDFGLGKGGNVLDFVMLYLQCDLKEALTYLSDTSLSFHQPKVFYEGISKEDKPSSFEIIKKQHLQNIALVNYLKSRCIPLHVASIFCFELYYRNNGKNYFSIAFENDSRGIELRNKYFKGCVGPKDIRTIKNGSNTVNLFEGFMDFLTFLHLPNVDANADDNIILNSLSLVQKTIPSLKQYHQVNLYLDNDQAGNKYAKILMEEIETKVKDCRSLYENHKDLNDFYKYQKSKKTSFNIKSLKNDIK